LLGSLKVPLEAPDRCRLGHPARPQWPLFGGFQQKGIANTNIYMAERQSTGIFDFRML